MRLLKVLTLWPPFELGLTIGGGLLCGSITVTPALTGRTSVTPLLSGETSITPALSGTVKVSECT